MKTITPFTATKPAWTVFTDSYDEDGIEIAPTPEEEAALVDWYGSGRSVELQDLGQPTFSEFGDSKSAAFQAALAAMDRATAN